MIYPRIARLLTSGATDTTFNPGAGLDGPGYAVATLADGSYIVGGDFANAGGEARTSLAKFNDDGTVAAEVDYTLDSAVRTLAAQTDSKVVVGGEFSTVGSYARSRLFRLQQDGTVEPAFNPTPDDTVWSICIHKDGKILIGGDFDNVGSSPRTGLARLLNDPAQTTLTVQSATTVLWERAGASPETEVVQFELSTDGGTLWTSLGYGTRVSGGWQLTGLSLSGDGLLRATAFPSASQSSASASQTIPFDFAPQIQVEQPEGTILTSGVSGINYGSSQVGSLLSKTFVIRNVGLTTLTLDDDPTDPVTIDGADSDQWTVIAQPPLSISPQGSVEVEVQFNPTTVAVLSATLTIHSDDPTTPEFTVAIGGTGTPGPGVRDDTFQPVANGIIYTTSFDTLNRTYLGGAFTSVNSISQNRISRVSTAGVVDNTFGGSKANDTVFCHAQQADGKVLVAGQFTTYNGSTRSRLARVLDTGNLDTGFSSNCNGTVNSVDIQPDGDIIVSGTFTTIKGVSRQSGVARVKAADGAVDASFNTWFTTVATLRRASVLSDGKILVFGSSVVRRVTSTGAKDLTFNSTGEVTLTGGVAYCAVEQADGKIVIGGNFTQVNATARTGLARLNEDGTLDTTFTCNTDGTVQGLALQVDGKIIAVGSFTTFGGDPEPRVARSLAAGGIDSSFPTDVSSGTVYGVMLQEDGKVLTSGDFVIEGTSVKVARLLNNETADTLSVISASAVQWLRSGTSPEVSYVEFQFSQDGGTTWSSVGYGERIAGGWEATGISLPVSGILRSLAPVHCGYGNGSLSLIESRVSFSGLASPDIQVEQPTNNVIADDGTVEFTGRLVGQIGTLDFTIRNTGNAVLSGISVVSSNPSEFTVIPPSASSIVAQGTTTFQIRFSPVDIGVRTASITIASNVPGFKNPYTINLTGNGITTPLASSQTAQSITSTSALLRGSVTARDDVGTVIFQWRLGSGPWNTVNATPSQAFDFTATPVTYSLTGLTAGTTYSFRPGITNSVTGPSSPVFGSIQTFATLP